MVDAQLTLPPHHWLLAVHPKDLKAGLLRFFALFDVREV